MKYSNYFDFTETMTEEGKVQAYRNIANWCNGNLLGITRIRMANLKKFGNPDGEKPNTEAGHTIQMSPTQRGDLFASIREYCFQIAEGKNWEGFDVPRAFSEYLEGRARGFRSAMPTKDEINEMVKNTLGITEDQARDLVMKSNAEQAAQIESDREDLIAMDSDYDTTIEVEEAQDRLPKMVTHRMRVKLFDGLMYECTRLLNTLAKYPNFQELRTKRELLLNDAIEVHKELVEFEKENDIQIKRELKDNPNLTLQQPLRGHMNTLQLVQIQLKQRHAA